jgi:2-amino-4-hydroxy-6-hydroxymethyldihydropteridine diphosphokinase
LIEQGIASLQARGVRIVRRSSLYETEPVGVEDQPWFLNAVVEGETALAPDALLRVCRAIESEAGREPSVRYGPRTLDIDILWGEGWIVNRSDLQIPHPRMRERRFVLIPLVEIAPHLTDPRTGEPYEAVLARLDERKKVEKSTGQEF